MSKKACFFGHFFGKIKLMEKDLKLKCMAIGSLPFRSVEEAIMTVKENFPEIPFWPQLTHANRNEDMLIEYTERIPGIRKNSETGAFYIESESDEFFVELEEFFMDYEEIISNPETELLNKYGISSAYASAFEPYLEFVKETKPKFAKGQIVGVFTLATSLNDKYKKCAFYDETLKEVLTKSLTLKALWQIKKIKEASSNTIPIIFMDEPSLSQLGTSAFITVEKEDVIEIIKSISDIIKKNGGLSAIHCCGKCDWDSPINTGVNIINLDGYFYAKNLSLFSKSVERFLKSGGLIAWGIVPTLDEKALIKADKESLCEKFDEAIGYLEKKGISKELLISHSMVTPTCGAGALPDDLAHKAMILTKELSQNLKE